MNTRLTRRGFIKSSAAGAVYAGIYSGMAASSWAQVKGTNGDIRIGVAGFNGKGAQHIRVLRKLAGVRVTALCDPDKDVIAQEVAKFEKSNEKVTTYTDVRKMLEDKEVDAILIAAPNHWHSLMAIWACQAGKDVYVEKPVCHDIWEGRRLVEAAKKYNRIVQGGFQNRSDIGLIPLFKWIEEGNIGKVKMLRGLCYKQRDSIGRVAGPQKPPESVAYDLWLGPAADEPIMREKFHYDWHWFWNYGNGDIGNQGPHELDLLRWALGDPILPKGVFSFGGRFSWNDNGETPNMQLAVFDCGDIPVIFEVRNLQIKASLKAEPHYEGIRVGIIVTCEGGEFRGGRGGGWVYDNKGEKIKQFKGDGGNNHQQNFIDAVRNRKESDLRSQIECAYLSSSMAHMANISFRLGKNATPEETAEQVKGDPRAKDALERFNQQLADNNVDLGKTPWTLGCSLGFDPVKEQFTGANADNANKFLRRDYRKPYEVPEKV